MIINDNLLRRNDAMTLERSVRSASTSAQHTLGYWNLFLKKSLSKDTPLSSKDKKTIISEIAEDNLNHNEIYNFIAQLDSLISMRASGYDITPELIAMSTIVAHGSPTSPLTLNPNHTLAVVLKICSTNGQLDHNKAIDCLKLGCEREGHSVDIKTMLLNSIESFLVVSPNIDKAIAISNKFLSIDSYFGGVLPNKLKEAIAPHREISSVNDVEMAIIKSNIAATKSVNPDSLVNKAFSAVSSILGAPQVSEDASTNIDAFLDTILKSDAADLGDTIDQLTILGEELQNGDISKATLEKITSIKAKKNTVDEPNIGSSELSSRSRESILEYIKTSIKSRNNKSQPTKKTKPTNPTKPTKAKSAPSI